MGHCVWLRAIDTGELASTKGAADTPSRTTPDHLRSKPHTLYLHASAIAFDLCQRFVQRRSHSDDAVVTGSDLGAKQPHRDRRAASVLGGCQA